MQAAPQTQLADVWPLAVAHYEAYCAAKLSRSACNGAHAAAPAAAACRTGGCACYCVRHRCACTPASIGTGGPCTAAQLLAWNCLQRGFAIARHAPANRPATGGSLSAGTGAPPWEMAGGTGYIGCCIVGRLLAAGHTVHATARRCEDASPVIAALNQLPGAAERLTWYTADLLEDGSFDAAVAGCK